MILSISQNILHDKKWDDQQINHEPLLTQNYSWQFYVHLIINLSTEILIYHKIHSLI